MFSGSLLCELQFDTAPGFVKYLPSCIVAMPVKRGTRKNKRISKRSMRGGLKKPGMMLEVPPCIFTAKLLDSFCETLTQQQLESGALYREAGCTARVKGDDCNTAWALLNNAVEAQPGGKRKTRRRKHKRKRQTRGYTKQHT